MWATRGTAVPAVTVVVLHFAHVSDTVRCVLSVRRSSTLDLECVVVSNSEDPDHRRRLREALPPDVELIDAGRNLGYAAGNNLALRSRLEDVRRTPEFFWVLNPDAEVERATLERLVAAARAVPDAAAVGTRIVHGDDPSRIWFDGGRVSAEQCGAASHPGTGMRVADAKPSRLRDVDYVSGASMLLRSLAVTDVGLLPEDYFLYFEETAYCVRLREKGWRVVMAPKARMRHYKRSSGSLPTDYYVYYMTRNRLRFSTEVAGFGADEVWAHHSATFVAGWRARVAERAPQLLDGFDTLVALGHEDFLAGRRGHQDLQAYRTFVDRE